VNVILATDCGSTTTKAILIEKRGEVYRQTYRGEAPTTVEAPFEDVTRGVLNSIAELEELSGRTLLRGEEILQPATETEGADVYISTSSAGGGLQMMVAGAVKTMTAESAQRAALGAGAIVMDVIASNDGRLPHERIERIRHLRPDMILLSGGTDGGTVTHVVELAEYIAAANPRPRLGITYQLPVIFAGNRDARDNVRDILGEKTSLVITDNLRPVLEREDLQPARHRIQDLFLEHVMAQAPGYKKLLSWLGAEIMPTPAAVGQIMQTIAEKQDLNIIGVDIGGATTDVFSVFRGIFNRTVSANLGMSYSVSNVFAEAGADDVLRWLPFQVDEAACRDQIKNKMIRPTTIPQTQASLQLEQALAREALRLAFEQHRALSVGLKGVQRERDISEAFEQSESGFTIDLKEVDLIVGSGGVLSHAPRREQAMMMLIDAFQPLGVTRLAVDSIFMMPHLGVLATVNEKAATDVFEKDCMVPLGTCLTANGRGKRGRRSFGYAIQRPDGEVVTGELAWGEIRLFRLAAEERASVRLTPYHHTDVGAGAGVELETEVTGGVVGLVLDGRGRPIDVTPADAPAAWAKELEAYPG